MQIIEMYNPENYSSWDAAEKHGAIYETRVDVDEAGVSGSISWYRINESLEAIRTASACLMGDEGILELRIKTE